VPELVEFAPDCAGKFASDQDFKRRAHLPAFNCDHAKASASPIRFWARNVAIEIPIAAFRVIAENVQCLSSQTPHISGDSAEGFLKVFHFVAPLKAC
jgi:hypothetical protein